MARKSIYIREGDRELWEKAERLAGDSLSGLLADVLRKYVAEKEGVLVSNEAQRVALAKNHFVSQHRPYCIVLLSPEHPAVRNLLNEITLRENAQF